MFDDRAHLDVADEIEAKSLGNPRLHQSLMRATAVSGVLHLDEIEVALGPGRAEIGCLRLYSGTTFWEQAMAVISTQQNSHPNLPPAGLERVSSIVR
jgi:hypothetical protein